MLSPASRRARPFGLILALGCAACANDGASYPRFDTGLDRDKPFLDLTDEESRTLCRAAEAYVEVIYSEEMTIRSACLGEAVEVGLANGIGACEVALEACIAAAAPLPPVDFDCDTATTARYPTCPGTVGQIEACADAAGRASFDLLVPLDCARAFEVLALPDPSLPFDQAVVDLEAGACLPVVLECPTFYAGLSLASAQIAAFTP